MILHESEHEYVYAVECQITPGGLWHQVTRWASTSPAKCELGAHERIVRRKLGEPEVVAPEYRLERFKEGEWGNPTSWYSSLDELSKNTRISVRPGQSFRIVRRIGDLVDVFKEVVA